MTHYIKNVILKAEVLGLKGKNLLLNGTQQRHTTTDLGGWEAGNALVGE